MISNGKVDFIGVGPPKTATTWLADNLRKHPDIFIPEKKELFYFNDEMYFGNHGPNIYRNYPLEWYHAFFRDSEQNQIWGEITPHYFESPNCPESIYRYNPKMKLIITLRDPIQKAVSQFKYGIQFGIIPPNAQFEEYTRKNPYILSNSLYSEYLKRYLKFFNMDQILILLQEDISSNPAQELLKVYDFIGVKHVVPADVDERSNTTKSVRFYAINRLIISCQNILYKYRLNYILKLLRWTGIIRLSAIIHDKWNVSDKKITVNISPEYRDELISFFWEDLKDLRNITNIDISKWPSYRSPEAKVASLNQ